MYYFCTYSHLNAEKHVDCFCLAKKKKKCHILIYGMI